MIDQEMTLGARRLAMGGGLSTQARAGRGEEAMEEGVERCVCTICGRRPSSVYVRVDARAERSSFSLGLFDIDVDRLLEDHPDVFGIVCLNCLLAYRRREEDIL